MRSDFLESVDWDKRYREGFYDGAQEPHDLLQRYWREIPGRVVVDIAMGNAKDAIFLAEKGFSVVGLERSWEAIKTSRAARGPKGQRVSPVQGNVASLPFREKKADAVTVFYFLLRGAMGYLKDLLKGGGVMFYETLLKRQNSLDRWRNPEHLLEDGELLSYFSEFDLILYEEGVYSSGNKKRAVAKYVGRKK
jgi:tellurite methyltransferase